MKKMFLLLAMLVLLQSCFSYKAMENDPSKMEAGKTYKIERNHKYAKVVFYSIKDSTILVNEKFEEKTNSRKRHHKHPKKKILINQNAGLSFGCSS